MPTKITTVIPPAMLPALRALVELHRLAELVAAARTAWWKAEDPDHETDLWHEHEKALRNFNRALAELQPLIQPLIEDLEKYHQGDKPCAAL